MAITKATADVIKDGEISSAKLVGGAAADPDNVSLLGFKLATADSLAIFNMKDGIVDDYNDATGVDASASTNEYRDSSSKYYSGVLAASAGQTEFNTVGDTTYTAGPGLTSITYLVVAGGGGSSAAAGADYAGGGGGAGGLRTGSYTVVAGNDYAVTVGAGGGAGLSPAGGRASSGGDSSFGTGTVITSTGGGSGGYYQNQPARDGGSGGGSSYTSMPGGAGNTPSTSPSQGNSGGTTSSVHASAGGGGAGATGGNSSSDNAGAGGAGSDQSATFGTSVGVSGWFAGGGAGGGHSGSSASGGQGGGGPSNAPAGTPGTAGTANTGGGAGGGATTGGQGADGGSGVVIVKWDAVTVYSNMTLVSNAQTAQAAPSNSRVCLLMDPSTGTTTLNTDIKAYVSRDNGTTYSQATLADEGTYTGTQKILAGTVDVSGQPSGTSMRYKITTHNQSAGVKETRIYGTALSW